MNRTYCDKEIFIINKLSGKVDIHKIIKTIQEVTGKKRTYGNLSNKMCRLGYSHKVIGEEQLHLINQVKFDLKNNHPNKATNYSRKLIANFNLKGENTNQPKYTPKNEDDETIQVRGEGCWIKKRKDELDFNREIDRINNMFELA